MKTMTQSPFLNPLIAFVSLVIVIALLILGKDFFIPLTLGVLCAFLLLPIVRRLEHLKVHRFFATVIVLVGMIAIIIGISTALSYAGSQFISESASYETSITNTIHQVREFFAQKFGFSIEEQGVWINENINILSIGAGSISSITSGFAKLFTTLSLMLLYTFFFLFYRKKIMTFLKKLISPHNEEMIVSLFKKMAQVVPRYLSGVFLVVLLLCIINSLGFWIIGVPNPIFFGVLAALLNIIPYVGPIIGFGLVVLFSLITTGPVTAFGVIIFFIMVQFFENNIITPTIAGKTVNINPFAAIIALIIGAKLWGVVGMIIALPLVGMIKIVADAIPQMNAWGYLIGGEE